MNSLGKFSKIILPLLALTACGVVPPRVNYSNYVNNFNGKPILNVQTGAYPFRLRSSIILISQDANNNINAQTSPNEFDTDGNYNSMYQIAGTDDHRSTTQLKITYLDNTKLIDQIQVTTQDNIADTINKIGTVAATIAPILAATVAGSQTPLHAAKFKPTTLDPTDKTASAWHTDRLNNDYCLRLRDSHTEQGLPLNQYFTASNGNSVIDFPVQACVSAMLDIAPCLKGDVTTINADSVTSIRVTYASLDTVTPMPLPSTGSLKMNSICGAQVTEADKQDRSDLLNYLNTLMKNVNSVNAALKKKTTN